MANTASEPVPETTASPNKQEKRKKGRPKEADRPFVPTARSFFDRLQAIHRDDWGTRAYIHLYRLEPFTDRLRSGTVVFIMKYAEPIDETRILMDHGSGRYRALLNFRKPSEEKDGELDRAEFDLLNLKFPPKVPKGEWVDDPRNKKWEWARNFFEDGQQQKQDHSLTEAIKVINDVRQAAAQEFRPAPDNRPSPTEELATVVTVAKDLAALQAPKDNGVPGFIQTELQALRTELAEARKRADEMMFKLLDARTAPGFSVQSIVDGADKILPLVERIWPAAKDGLNRVRPVRSNMSGWQEFLQPIIPAAMNSPLWNVIGAAITRSWQTPPNTPQMPPPSITAAGQPQQNGAQQQVNPMIALWNEIARPMLHYLAVDADPAELGDEFASWVYDGWAADPRYDQVMQMARTMGTQQCMLFFQQSPLWPHLAPQQAKFTTFLEAFLKWAPPAEEASDGIEDVSEEAEAAAHA